MIALLAALALALPPCPTEDAPGPCTWDAAARGNHVGQSFVSLAPGVRIPVTLPAPTRTA